LVLQNNGGNDLAVTSNGSFVFSTAVANYLPPLCQPQPTSAGSGDGLPCDVCGQLIASDDVQYEIEHAERLQTIRVHLRCHDIWKESLRRI
jgi:hypothetical protein